MTKGNQPDDAVEQALDGSAGLVAIVCAWLISLACWAAVMRSRWMMLAARAAMSGCVFIAGAASSVRAPSQGRRDRLGLC
jgi:hypothetical protein